MPSQSIKEICVRLKASPEALSAVTSKQSYIPLLPLLEHPLQEVESQLRAKLVEAGLAAPEVECVSLERPVLFALFSWGSHWPELAVSWLEAGFPINEPIARRLEKMSQEDRPPQAVRHRAFTLAKRWRRTQEQPEAQ